MKISRTPPSKVDYIVITGDGGREYDVLKGICCKYRDKNKILWFPRKIFIKRTGLEALDSVKMIPSDLNLAKIIYTVDRDVIEGDIERNKREIKIHWNRNIGC
jgi:hypothetical protein